MLGEGERLDEIYNAIERRVAVNPEHFHTVVKVIKKQELKDVGDQMEGNILKLFL